MLSLCLQIDHDISAATSLTSMVINVDKAFAGERFVFADSRSLGPAPWDTRFETPRLRALKRGGSKPPSRTVKRRLKCPTSNVSDIYLYFGP
jgi:hypothetical protein